MQKDSSLPNTDSSRSVAGLPKSFVARLLASREISVLAVLFLLAVVMLALPQRGQFYSAGNIQNILLQVGLLSIFAIGETIVIICGGIDLSLGSLIAFSGMLLAFLVNLLAAKLFDGLAVGLAIVITLGVSWAIGFWHTLLIHRIKLPAFVVTLVSLLALRSQSLIMNHHQQILVEKKRFPLFDWLANGGITITKDFALPLPVILLAIVGITMALVLTKTKMGRYLYSVGSNEQATMLSGVSVFKVKLFAYGVSALLGGLAGLLYMGYGGQGDPSAGNSYELDAVASAVVGGASLSGGQGSILGTVVGACLLNSIFSAINLTLSQPDIWRGTVVGGVLLLAVLSTAFQQRNKRS